MGMANGAHIFPGAEVDSNEQSASTEEHYAVQTYEGENDNVHYTVRYVKSSNPNNVDNVISNGIVTFSTNADNLYRLFKQCAGETHILKCKIPRGVTHHKIKIIKDVYTNKCEIKHLYKVLNNSVKNGYENFELLEKEIENTPYLTQEKYKDIFHIQEFGINGINGFLENQNFVLNEYDNDFWLDEQEGSEIIESYAITRKKYSYDDVDNPYTNSPLSVLFQNKYEYWDDMMYTNDFEKYDFLICIPSKMTVNIKFANFKNINDTIQLEDFTYYEIKNVELSVLCKDLFNIKNIYLRKGLEIIINETVFDNYISSYKIYKYTHNRPTGYYYVITKSDFFNDYYYYTETEVENNSLIRNILKGCNTVIISEKHYRPLDTTEKMYGIICSNKEIINGWVESELNENESDQVSSFKWSDIESLLNDSTNRNSPFFTKDIIYGRFSDITQPDESFKHFYINGTKFATQSCWAYRKIYNLIHNN